MNNEQNFQNSMRVVTINCEFTLCGLNMHASKTIYADKQEQITQTSVICPSGSGIAETKLKCYTTHHMPGSDS